MLQSRVRIQSLGVGSLFGFRVVWFCLWLAIAMHKAIEAGEIAVGPADDELNSLPATAVSQATLSQRDEDDPGFLMEEDGGTPPGDPLEMVLAERASCHGSSFGAAGLDGMDVTFGYLPCWVLRPVLFPVG